MDKTKMLHSAPREPNELNPQPWTRYPPIVGATDRIVEWTAIFNPNIWPVSPLDTVLVTAAVRMALTRQRAQVSGRRRMMKLWTSVRTVWKGHIFTVLVNIVCQSKNPYQYKVSDGKDDGGSRQRGVIWAPSGDKGDAHALHDERYHSNVGQHHPILLGCHAKLLHGNNYGEIGSNQCAVKNEFLTGKHGLQYSDGNSTEKLQEENESCPGDGQQLQDGSKVQHISIRIGLFSSLHIGNKDED